MPETFTIQIEISGVKVFEKTMKMMALRARSMRVVWSEITKDFRRIAVRQFDTEGAYLGTPWSPLRPTTLESKGRARGTRSMRILQRTNRLRQSYTQGRGGYRVQTSTTLKLGTLIPYAAPLEMGFTHRSGRRVPARPVMTITSDIRERWEGLVAAWVYDGDIKSGLIL